MARIQVYIPHEIAGSDVKPEDALKQVGLEYMSRGADVFECPQGPDGKLGRRFVWLDQLCMRGADYKPDEQTWIPAAQRNGLGSDRYWVGIWDDSPPTEEELRRPDHRKGKFVKLGNKASWLITTPQTLDRVARLKRDGSIQWCVDEAFNWLVTGLEKIEADSVIRDGDTEVIAFDLEREFWFACELMQINYRVTPEVCSHLGLITEDTVRPLVAGLMGRTLKGD